MEKQTDTDTSEYDVYIGYTFEDYIDMREAEHEIKKQQRGKDEQ